MKLSVCLITFNHELFIAKTLESIIAQITDFPFEIIIGEDGSTDSTREICESFREKYPSIIKLLPKERNMGMMNNFIRTYKHCAGEYISFSEGDDYWTDQNKLQQQVDFLQKNNEYSASFHNVKMEFIRNGVITEKNYHTSLNKDIFHTVDLLCQWFIPSCSIVIRNYNDFLLPEWFPHCKSGDIPFILLLSLRGPIKYLDKIMGVYRVHDNGISTTHKGYFKIIAMIFIYENFNIYTRYQFKDQIKEAIIYEIEYHLPFETEKKMSLQQNDSAIDHNKQILETGKNNLISRIYRRASKMVRYKFGQPTY